MAVLDIPARKAVQQMTIIPTKEKLTSSSIASWTDLQIPLPRFSEQTLLFTASSAAAQPVQSRRPPVWGEKAIP
jgi:hypothetical protein